MRLVFFLMFSLLSLPVYSLLTPEEVINQMNMELKGVEKLTPEAKDRLKEIIPDANFIGTQGANNFTAKNVDLSGTEADLRSKDAPVVKQWNGTCTAHGLAAVLENLSGKDLSERHVWSKYRTYSCESAIAAWEGKGCITTEKLWPHKNIYPKVGYRSSKNCSVKLKKATYIGNDLQLMINSLDEGRPVYIGMAVTTSLINCDTVTKPNSKKTSGGHALSVVGYYLDNEVVGGGYFIVKNSWGKTCGEGGYQYISFNHCLRKDLYCMMWTIEV